MPRLLERAVRFARGALPRTPRPAILAYHRIARETFDPWGLAIEPRLFERQLTWMARHRRPMPLTELAQRHRDGSLPGDAIAITFDDGYACNVETAAPLLDRMGIPGTIFLPAELVRRGGEFWWDELQPIVLDCRRTTLPGPDGEVLLGERDPGDWHWQPDPTRRTARQRAYYDLWSRLRLMPDGERDAILAGLRAACDVGPSSRPSRRMMTPNEARSLRSSAIAFGSHAMTHQSLPTLPSAAKAAEIRDSIAACEDISGERPRTFAYPFGEHDPESETLVEESGFLCACTTDARVVGRGTPPFALPRIGASNRGTTWLRRTLALAPD